MSFGQNVSNSSGLALRSDLHLVRKLWHIGTGSFVLCVYFSQNLEARAMSYGLILLSSFGFMLDFSRVRLDWLNNIVLKFLGPFMRESERDSVSGLPFYALGSGLSLFLFEEKIAILSICFLILADPISSVFGIIYGKDQILKNKSLQGSLAGFITCYLVSLTYGIFYGEMSLNLILFSIFAGVIGSLSELCSVYVDDNLTIPVVSGAGLTAINLFIPIL